MTPWSIAGLDTVGDDRAWAVFSPDRKYRYLLGRTWGPNRPTFCIDMMNPSLATDRRLDPTLTRVVSFAVREGCGGILVRNLSAFITPYPQELLAVPDPIGPRNLEVLAMGSPGPRVAAWGRLQKKLAPLFGRSKATIAETMRGQRWSCFGLTECEPYEPRHPLMLASVTRLQDEWEPVGLVSA
jgi:hypothetical protein